MQRVHTAGVVVQPVEQTGAGSFVMENGEFRSVKEASRPCEIERGEVSKLFASDSKGTLFLSGSECAVGAFKVAMWLVLTKTRPGYDVDYQTGLIAEFGGDVAGDDRNGLNRVDRKLGGKCLAPLVRDWLVVY